MQLLRTTILDDKGFLASHYPSFFHIMNAELHSSIHSIKTYYLLIYKPVVSMANGRMWQYQGKRYNS